MRITDGVQEREVSKGAYKSIFKQNGWVPCDEELVEDSDDEVVVDDDDDDEVVVDDDDEEEELEEKPLSKMNLSELKEYAELKGVDIDGLETKKEIKEAIIEAMNE